MKVIGNNPDHFQPVTNFERVIIKEAVHPITGAEGQTIKREDPPPFHNEPSAYVIDFMQKRRARQKKKNYVDQHKTTRGKDAYATIKQPIARPLGTKLNLEV